MELRIKKTHPDAIIPSRAKPGDSGLDLHACLPIGGVVIPPGEHRVIPTGIAIEPGEGLEGQVRPRSGLAAKSGVMASLGTIDNGYRGEIAVNLFNLSFQTYRVSDGDRIAQLVICPVAYPAVVEVTELTTERGDSGFGSTGV